MKTMIAMIEVKVIAALENSKYDWRTVEGIANETKLPPEKILQIIKTIESVTICSIPDEKGHTLYTTRDHYYKTHNLISRFITAASGRIRI